MCKTWWWGAKFAVAVGASGGGGRHEPLAGSGEGQKPTCYSCSRTGTSHSAQRLIYSKQFVLLRAIFMSFSLTPESQNDYRVVLTVQISQSLNDSQQQWTKTANSRLRDHF